MKTLYLTDLDGTLLRANQQISEFSLQTINAALRKGTLFSYATARSFSSAQRVTQGLSLFLPVITYNGVFLIDPESGRYLDACLLEEKHLGELPSAIRGLELLPLVYALIDGRERVSWLLGKETPGISRYLLDRKGDPRLRPVSSYEELFMGDIFYLTIIAQSKKAAHLAPLLQESRYLRHHTSKDIYTKELWLEVYHTMASKASAGEKLLRLAGADRLVCFGDGENDIPMFCIADASYAVFGAHENLQKVATKTIASNEQDAVAHALLALIEEDLAL